MNIKQYIEIVKTNLALLLLFPAILGGLWQLVELSSMSLSYIRFFSPSQLLPDGLLILYVLLIFLLLYIITKKMINDKRLDLPKKMQFQQKPISHYYIKKFDLSSWISWIIIYDRSRSKLFSFVLVFTPMMIISGLYYVIIPFFVQALEKDYSIMVFTIFTAMSIVFITIVIDYIRAFLLIHLREDNKILIFLDQPYFMIMISLIIFIFLFFHKHYMFPENLMNLKYLDNKMKNEKYISNNIRYFNDKYIFIEHLSDNNRTTIEIVKFESLIK